MDNLMDTENKEGNQAELAEAEPEEEGMDADGFGDDGGADQTMESLMEMYEESLKRFEEGEVVNGRIISVDKDHVLVDVGYKSEGQISIHEFRNDQGDVEVDVDDVVEVMIEWWDEEEERVILSKEKAAKVKIWESIREIYEADGTVEGVISNRVKGGFSVDVGIQAFLPGSQADLRPIRNLDEMVGKTFEFKVLKFNRKRNNIVLSRRVILETERESKRAETLAAIEEGRTMEGTVKNITEYGVFVDLGGVDGLLHITDISWGRVKHPSELFGIGDSIKVMILSFDQENERVSLGMKQLVPDPWSFAEEKYPVGTRITGRVVSLTDYGAFVEVEEGIEGLIHKGNLVDPRQESYEEAIKRINVGDIMRAVVVELSPAKQKLGLSVRELERLEQRQEVNKYLHEEDDESATVTLGDMLKEKDTM